MTAFFRRGALFLTSTALGAALSALPLPVAAQDGPVPAAMAEPGGQLTAANFAAVVPVGGTITWTNLGTQAHTVTSADGAFDSGLVAPGDSATIEFDTPGDFAYVCTPHPWMKGIVHVSADAVSASNMAMAEPTPNLLDANFAVVVPAGGTIEWSNTGSQPHTVTSAGNFDSGFVAPGTSWANEFDVPGTYTYTCTPHPWMKGVVVVQG
jgi:plastocyanin